MSSVSWANIWWQYQKLGAYGYNTYLILYFKDIDCNFIIKLIASLKFVYSTQTHIFLAGEGGTGSMTWSLNHSLSVLSITLVSFPLFLTCTFSGSDTGRLRGNKNQMDIVQKLPKWVRECGELSGMERSWNFSAIKWDLSPLYHSHCRQPFTLTETPFQQAIPMQIFFFNLFFPP